MSLAVYLKVFANCHIGTVGMVVCRPECDSHWLAAQQNDHRSGQWNWEKEATQPKGGGCRQPRMQEQRANKWIQGLAFHTLEVGTGARRLKGVGRGEGSRENPDGADDCDGHLWPAVVETKGTKTCRLLHMDSVGCFFALCT